MGRVLNDAKVKVSGMDGPLKKGLPLSTVIGKGGLYGLYMGRPITPRMKVPGFKSLLKRRVTSGKIKNPPWSTPQDQRLGLLPAPTQVLAI